MSDEVAVTTAEEQQSVQNPPVEEPTKTAAESETASGEVKDQQQPDAPKEKDQPKKDGGFQRRIDKLTREKYELERRHRELLERQEDLLNRLEGKATAKTSSSEDPEPQPDQFDTYEKYVKAQARWEARQEYKAQSEKDKAESAKKTEEENFKQVQKEHERRVREAQAEYEDWEDVFQQASDINIPDAAANAIMHLPNGPHVAYHLASHRDEAIKLASMSPLAAAAEVGRISARLEKAAESSGQPKAADPKPTPSPQPVVSNAPPPITPPKKTGASPKGLDDEVSDKEWAERFREVLRKKG